MSADVDPFRDLQPLESVYGARQVRQLQAHLQVLRQRERCGAHGNRQLFLSDIFIAQLLAFHLPIVRSLRTLEALSCTPVARRMLTVDRLARSTLSDAQKTVDPALLAPIIDDLVRRVDAQRLPAELDTLLKRLVAVDGTFLRVVGQLLWTLQQHTDNGRVVSKPRLDVQLDVQTAVPRFAVLSGHERSESNAARLRIEAGKIYLADKAYFSFKLLGDWLDAQADFVVALNSQIRFTPQENETAGQPAAANGPSPAPGTVLSDRCGHLTGCDKSAPPARRLREVVILRENGESLRLLTSLTDPAISAVMIGELYRRRWTIELFFRWLKSCANFRHVISHSPQGLSVALYVAIIGTLLTALVTGRRPSKYALAALQFVAAGLAELKDVLPTLERYEREREQARARQQRRLEK